MKKAKMPPYLFQMTRRILMKGERNYTKSTVFLSNDDTLKYLSFETPYYTFWDECIAVWRMKSLNTVTTNG
jgi:hypothetical protein